MRWNRSYYSSRRSVLKGLTLGAGATALTPLLDRLVSEARGQSKPAKRLVMVLSGNGFLQTQRFPGDLGEMSGGDLVPPGGRVTGESRNWTNKLQNLPLKAQLPPWMDSLLRHKDRMLLLDDLQAGVGAGHWQSYAAMSCVANASGESPGGITFDQFMAERMGKDSPLPLLPLGVVKDADTQYVQSISAYGAGRPITMSCNPTAVYNMLFGAAAGDKMASKRNRKILDFLNEDVKRAQGKLAGSERVKFDQYLAALDAAGTRQQKIETVTAGGRCQAPKGTDTGMYTLAQIEGRMEAMFNLAGAAMACNLSRVVTLSLNTYTSFDARYTGLGYTLDLHSIGHGGKDPKFGGDAAIHNYHASLIGKLVDTLKGIPEGNGSVFDNTVIAWLNDNGTSHHSRPWQPWFVTLIGSAGGSINANGRYVRFTADGTPTHRRMTDFYTTLANALDVKVASFAPQSPLLQKGIIPEIVS